MKTKIVLCLLLLASIVSIQAQKGITTLECYACANIPAKDCDICTGFNEKRYLNGLLVKQPGDTKLIDQGFIATKKGNSVELRDWEGDIAIVRLKDTKYNNINDLISFILDCKCQSGGGGGPGDSTDVFLNNGLLVGTTLQLNMSDGDNINIDLSSLVSGEGETIQSVSYDGSILTITTDQGSYTTPINVSTIENVSPITIGGAVFNAGTTLETILNAISTALDNVSITDNGNSFTFTDAAGNTTTINLAGGGGGALDTIYSAGNGVTVRADGPGITAAYSGAGNLEITVPASVLIKTFRIFGTPSNLSAGEVQITVIGGKGSGVTYNTSDADSWHPFISIQNRSVVLPTDPYLQRPYDATSSFNVFNERFSVSGRSTIKVTGLSGDWGLFGQF